MRKTIPFIGIALASTLALGACGNDDEPISAGDRAKASAAALAHVGGGAVTDAELGEGDDGYAYGVEVTLPSGTDIDVELDEAFKVTNTPPKASDFEAVAPAATPPAAAAPAPVVTNAADDDRPLTGSTLKKASKAALAATGGGRITETSGSDDLDHVYEVDIDLANGEDVTVELDKSYKVTKIDR